MMTLPEGIEIGFMRHAESKKNRSQAKGHDSSLTKQRDALTENGKLQAYEMGKYLHKRFGRFDVIISSNYRRAQQTVHYMMLGQPKFKPRYMHMMGNLWIEQVHDAIRNRVYKHWYRNVVKNPKLKAWAQLQEKSLAINSMLRTPGDSADRTFFEEVGGSILVEDLQVWKSVWALLEGAMTSLGEVDAAEMPDFLQHMPKDMRAEVFMVIAELVYWAFKQERLPVLMKREHVLDEPSIYVWNRSMHDLMEVISMFSQPPYHARKFLVLAHSKLIAAQRAVLERMSEDESRALFKSIGPPYPPNVSLTMYETRGKRFVRNGEPNILSPNLVPNGQLLDWNVTAKSLERIKSAIERKVASLPALPASVVSAA